jgi:hypothetical protein
MLTPTRTVTAERYYLPTPRLVPASPDNPLLVHVAHGLDAWNGRAVGGRSYGNNESTALACAGAKSGW